MASVLREAEIVLQLLSDRGVLSARIANVAKKRLRGARLRAIDDSDAPSVLCHGDLRRPNVFFDGATITFIDFELAGRADPAIDLARTVAYERLDRHGTFVLLDAYSEASGDDATLDRALSILDPVRLGLVLSAIRWVSDVSAGRIMTARAPDPERVKSLKARLSEILDVEVSLPIEGRP